MTEADPATATKILGKFENQEALVEAYKQLEQKLGVRENPKIGITPAGGDTPETPEATNAKAKLAAQLQTALAALRAGDPKAQGMLTALGVEPSLAQYTHGLAVAGQEKYAKSVFNAAGGGKESYEQLLNWVVESDNLSQFEKDSFTRELDSGDPNRTIVAVQTMRQRHVQETGFEPKQLVSIVPGGQVERVTPFANAAARSKAFADKRYGTDEAYTAKVRAQAQVSDVD